MRSRQLIVLSFVLACVKLSDARFLSLTEPTLWAVDVEVESAAEPEREYSRKSAQQAGRLQEDQIHQAVEPLSWKFPEDPVDSVKKPPFEFKLRQPATDSRVAVRCGESRIQVEVSQDLLGLGRLVKPEEITLGGRPATEVDNLSHVLVFECELHGCGSTLAMTENAFIYAFMLIYNPKVSGRIIRSQSAVIGVECHYPR
ncbi:zona pellucida sperm-binding protein 3-like [Plectropomus leopardus]|uniref:zona pellucida sperm-binding protein 3-like n=1 Tax=Plectropomus leopardus TaxID=160734 RepID=UPI001C4B0610|nr:zona pellucida sperm-binding protein 3-like [Plectropomus leopardus]